MLCVCAFFPCAFIACRGVRWSSSSFFSLKFILKYFSFAYFYANLIFHGLLEGDVVQWSFFLLTSQNNFLPVKFVIVPFPVASPLSRLLVLSGHCGDLLWVRKWLDFLAFSGLLLLTCCPHGHPCSLQLLFSPCSTSLPGSCFEILISGMPDTPFIPSIFLPCRCW